MKKVFLLATMMLIASISAYAQDDYPKFELSPTWSMLVADIDILDNETLHGYGISGQFNLTKSFSLVGEWAANHGASGPVTFTEGGIDYVIPELDTRVQTMLFGPRLTYRRAAVNVFGHWLVGAGTNKLKDESLNYNWDERTAWQFAMAIGGGLDVNLGKNFAIRAAQFDWAPIHSDIDLEGSNFLNNIRYQAGVVLKF